MPYDTILWGEEAAKNGLTGTAALDNQNHLASGDKLTLLSDPSPPYLQGLGSLSDTKPQGCALVPDKMDAQNPIKGPGAILFYPQGWDVSLRYKPICLVKGDNLTGQCSSTNVNEGSIVAADISYGKTIVPFDISQGRYKQIYRPTATITSAAAVTFNSGGVALDSAISDWNKFGDVDASYEILGTFGCIGAATFGGICNVSKLGGEWAKRQPGLIVNPLSAVTFSPGGFVPVLEPIPFRGDALPQVGMTAPSAGAVSFGMVIGEK
jgi:hypothetical protein